MVTVVVSPPPTPNGPLHVGHLSGPYVAADVAVRAARARGETVRHVCGLDSNQNYVLAKAEAAGEPVEAVMDRYAGQIREAFRLARVEHDVFVDPVGDQSYRDAVAGSLTDLVARGVVKEADTELMTCGGCGRVLHHTRVVGRCAVCGSGSSGGTCEGCGGFQRARDLLDVAATCCGAGAGVEVVVRRVPVFRMEEYREVLHRHWSRATLPASVRRLVGRYLTGGVELPEIPMAYPTDWGIPWTGADGTELRIDVWIEMALGYVRTTAAIAAEAGEDVSEIWYLCGVDNSFYYSAMIPALMAACGVAIGSQSGVIANEFYRLDGLKFSTSRNHAVWALDFLVEEDPAVVRAYLCWDRPDVFGTDFTREGFAAFKDRWAAAGTTGGVLAGAEVGRAERALTLAAFDPALAVRCAMAVGARAAGHILAAVCGE